MELLKFILSTSACSWILTTATVFTWLRTRITNHRSRLQVVKHIGRLNQISNYFVLPLFKFLDKIFNCPACMGFWIGALFYLRIPEPFAYDQWFFHALIGSGCSMINHRLAKFLNK